MKAAVAVGVLFFVLILFFLMKFIFSQINRGE